MNNIAFERRKAVALAWKTERARVLSGEGTRDWSQREQREIIFKGKVKGFQGHHMKSVDGHNSRAGDARNIQFLTRKEHLAAHGGDYHNNTNGYYDPNTKIMNGFGRSAANIDSKKLSHPLTDSQKQYALRKANAISRATVKSAVPNHANAPAIRKATILSSETSKHSNAITGISHRQYSTNSANKTIQASVVRIRK